MALANAVERLLVSLRWPCALFDSRCFLEIMSMKNLIGSAVVERPLLQHPLIGMMHRTDHLAVYDLRQKLVSPATVSEPFESIRIPKH